MLVKKPPKKLIKICKRLKIKLTRKSRSGKRVYKTQKQLIKEIKKKKPINFIKKANARSIKKGTVGAFRKWCKSKKLINKSGKVTMKCIKRGLKDKNGLIRRRANYARNIGGYSKRSAFGPKKPQRGLSFGLIDQERFNRYSAAGWIVPKSDFPKRSWTRVKRNCEDGESGVLFNKIIPGMYVNLGHGKCFSIQEILDMHDNNRFLKDKNGVMLNPFTRQPLTRKQLIKLNDILVASGRADQHVLDLPEFEDIDDFFAWSNYLVDVLRTQNVTEGDQKKIISILSQINGSGFKATNDIKNTKWTFQHNRIYIMTPNGWMLPENMHGNEWWSAGMTEQEYEEVLENSFGNKKSSKNLAKRSAFGAKRSAFGPKRSAFGPKKSQRGLSFGVIDQQRFDRYSAAGWNAPQSDFPKRSWTRVKRNCEDGESGILNNKIIPGMYVNLGYKKCFSIQEILDMSANNRFLKNKEGELLNPFTRQKLTTKQLMKINDILRAANRPLLQLPNMPPNVPPANFSRIPVLPEGDTGDWDYMERLVDTMMSGTLTEPELKEGFRIFVTLSDYGHLYERLFRNAPRDVFWRIHDNKLQFKSNFIFNGNDSGWVDMDEVFQDGLVEDINMAVYDNYESDD